jgi:hypothetical protein
MKKLIIHGTWLVVALGAFAAGKILSNQGTPSNATSESTRLILSQANGDRISTSSGKSAKGSDETSPVANMFSFGKGMLKDSEIEGFVKIALSDPNPLKRDLAFARLLESMTPENAELIRDQLRSGKAGGDQWRLFQYAWGAIDPAGAMASAEALDDERRKSFAIGTALSGWASSDPTAAINWLSKMEEGDMKNRMQGELVNGLADANINTATQYVLELMNAGNPQAGNYMESVASEKLRGEGPVAAAQWSEQLPNGEVKGAAMDRVANAFVAQDPQGAATWAQQFATEDYAVRLIEEVGDEWAERDPAASVGWLETLADGKGKSEGMSSALGEWVRRDPEAASKYLLDMPASSTKDSAVSGFVSRLAWDDPTAALTWADTIGQENVRIESITQAGQAWMYRDREAATQWLQSSGLPEATQAKILNPPRRDRRGRG